MHLTSPATTIFTSFHESLLDLFACCSSEVPLITETISSKVAGEMTAIIGLSDDRFAASVAITTTEASAVNLSYMVPANAADWLGKLVHQLAIQTRNKLSCYGLAPTLGVPTIVRGQWIQMDSCGDATCLFTAKFKQGEVTAQLSLDLDPDLKLVVHELQATAPKSLGF